MILSYQMETILIADLPCLLNLGFSEQVAKDSYIGALIPAACGDDNDLGAVATQCFTTERMAQRRFDDSIDVGINRIPASLPAHPMIPAKRNRITERIQSELQFWRTIHRTKVDLTE